MATEVVPESKTLHITKLRFRWQILITGIVNRFAIVLNAKMSEL